MTPQQHVKASILKGKALGEELLGMPLERPNPTQTWTEFHELYKTFIRLTGNAYIYKMMPEDGMNAGTPVAVYLLPSHDIRIVVKTNASMLGVESPIDSYMLIQGNQYLEFDGEKVIHIKYANPNYSEDGAHLYGQSPLRAALKNLQSSNKGLDLNIKTLQSGGAFGLIHGKGAAINTEQAREIKDRLQEMNSNPEDLAKIAGVSAEVGFTRLSLTSAELKPFDYLDFDQKQIANVLGWSDKLLNNADASTMNNVDNERKRVVTDNIKPDLDLLADALNKEFIPLFKGYENAVIMYDISELPEMQQDTKQMVEWAVMLLDKGVIHRDDVREIVTFPPTGEDNMRVYTVANDVLTLDEAVDSEFRIDG
jgi:HK97 family phage portal protein